MKHMRANVFECTCFLFGSKRTLFADDVDGGCCCLAGAPRLVVRRPNRSSSIASVSCVRSVHKNMWSNSTPNKSLISSESASDHYIVGHCCISASTRLNRCILFMLVCTYTLGYRYTCCLHIQVAMATRPTYTWETCLFLYLWYKCITLSNLRHRPNENRMPTSHTKPMPPMCRRQRKQQKIRRNQLSTVPTTRTRQGTLRPL